MGEVALNEVENIINKARSIGINKIDTAPSYGSSELKLGKCNINDFKITTKISVIPDDIKDIRGFISKEIESSLKNLKLESIESLLFHKELDLTEKKGIIAFEQLKSLQSQGVIRNIGISTYFRNELNEILNEFEFDIVQVPFNIIDQRLNKYKSLFIRKKLQIQVRSIFLQGILLISPEVALTKCKAWSFRNLDWQNFLKLHNLTAYEASLFFVLSNDLIEDYVIGIESIKQLDLLLNAIEKYNGYFDCDTSMLSSENLELINPFMWKE